MGGDAITVNAIAPGLTLVEATEYVPQARHEHYLNGRAIQRPQIPEDVNAAALFLLTQGSGFITGQLLPVNGGFVMH
jgi:NAD(P)-dependent dehydrogenase (short-subunit alcohol dehydrogenase family)